MSGWVGSLFRGTVLVLYIRYGTAAPASTNNCSLAHWCAPHRLCPLGRLQSSDRRDHREESRADVSIGSQSREISLMLQRPPNQVGLYTYIATCWARRSVVVRARGGRRGVQRGSAATDEEFNGSGGGSNGVAAFTLAAAQCRCCRSFAHSPPAPAHLFHPGGRATIPHFPLLTVAPARWSEVHASRVAPASCLLACSCTACSWDSSILSCVTICDCL
eukprot:COSAG02_NODE_2693_length_8220_cov_3.340106_7_plen_218_part_00